MAKAKEILHTSKQCGGSGVFEVKYDENNTPFLQCNSCSKVVDDWIRWRNQYAQYWTQDDKWASKKDHIVCILGYFAHKYREHYGVDFVFSLNERGLFNGKETFIIRKTYNMLDGDAVMCRKYIDWLFVHKIARKNKRVTSISFIAVSDLVQEFKFFCKKERVITRDKPIPDKMTAWVREHTPEILNNLSLRDFGELRMALHAYKAGDLGHVPGLDVFIQRLRTNNVISEDFNIIGWSDK
jgi:hypothetical protein